VLARTSTGVGRISKQVVEGISPPLYIYADAPVRIGDADASA
jgi:hypothetical protein